MYSADNLLLGEANSAYSNRGITAQVMVISFLSPAAMNFLVITSGLEAESTACVDGRIQAVCCFGLVGLRFMFSTYCK